MEDFSSRLADAHKAAQAALCGEVSVLEATRFLVQALRNTHLSEMSEYLTLLGIDSETDDLPLGDVRQYWSLEALRIKDQEISAYESAVRDKFISACRRIAEWTV